MTVSNGDVLKVVYECLFADGSIWQNVYHLQAALAAPYADGTVMAAITTWLDDMIDEVVNQMSNAMTQSLCAVDKVAWDGTKWAVTENLGYVLPTPTFAAADDPLPRMDASFVLFHTARPKSNGKKYLAGYTEATQDDGILITAALTALALYAGVVLDGILLAPLNNLVSGVPREAADVFLPFTLAVATDLMMTQRRRRQGVGA